MRSSEPSDRCVASAAMAVMAQTEERPWLEELNDEQRAAATHAGGPLLILAGAGTGKTTTLCARVAWLVTEGVPAERILLLTFTRRASREMLQRARGLVPRSSRVLGGTFHSVAHRLVRRHAAALGLPGGFGVLDAGDAADVLDLLREEHGHAKSRDAVPEEGDAAGHLLAHGQRAGAAVGRDRGALPVVSEHREAISALFKAYTARKRELGVARSRRPAAVLARAGRRRGDRAAAGRGFDHVLIDEYQDVNGLQVDLARSLGVARADGDRGRRRLPGDLRLPLRLGRAHPRLPGALPRHAGGDAGAQLPLDAARPGRGERGRRAGDARVPEASARGPRGRRPPARGPRARQGGPGRGGLRPDPGGARAGHGAARAGRAGAHVARLRPAGARADPPPRPVPQVRRPALPRGRAREGLRRDAAPGRQRRRRRRLVPRAAARRGRRPGERAPGDRARWPATRPARWTSRRDAPAADASAAARSATGGRGGAGPARRVGVGARRRPAAARERGCADRRAARGARRSRAPARGPRGCGTCSRR